MPSYEHKGSVHLFAEKEQPKKKTPGWLIGLAVFGGLILLIMAAG